MSDASRREAGDGETGPQRLDRELIELLNELRVALPGAQVLFAFLLTVPFSTRFDRLTSMQRSIFFAAFIATAVATVLLLAPSAHHRARWREMDKERLLRGSNRLTLAGLVVLIAAMSASTMLIADVVFGRVTASVITGVITAGIAWLWFGIPLVRKASERRR